MKSQIYSLSAFILKIILPYLLLIIKPLKEVLREIYKNIKNTWQYFQFKIYLFQEEDKIL